MAGSSPVTAASSSARNTARPRPAAASSSRSDNKNKASPQRTLWLRKGREGIRTPSRPLRILCDLCGKALMFLGRHAMRFAIAIPTDADSWRVVRRAEELGFARAWFYDTQMLSADPLVAMAAAAMKTTTIRLGTGVLIPSNRIAPVAANAFASLNKLAPGRIDFGIGTGFTGRRAMGLGAVKLADMETYIETVTALLREETVEAELEGKRRLIRLLNPELGLINTRDPIGLYIAASGPLACQLTARLGAGWINTTADVAGGVAALAEMRGLWGAAGQAGDALEAIVLTGGVVLADGEPADSPRAVAQAGPRAAMLLHRAADAALMGWPAIAAIPPALADTVAGYVE